MLQNKERTMGNNEQIKETLIAEIKQKVKDRILEKSNADLLEKLINRADNINEAMAIAELGTMYEKTGLKFDVRLEKMSNDIKYFQKNKKLSFHFGDTKPTHKLIIGDNYDALQNLLIEYKGKIDVIYIDPPYGKDSMGEFATTNYKNNITRDNLLSMLYPRLMLAKQLLSNEGVIFCSIDDKNQAYVKCLFDKVFGERNFVCNFSCLSSGRKYDFEDFDNTDVKVLGANLGMYKGGVEYVLCYRSTSTFKFAMKKTEQDIIDSRITKNGNNISTLKFPKGLQIDGVIDKIFTDYIGGNSERIEILNKEGMIFKNGVLQNDVELRSCFANPNMVQKFFAGEEVIDNRGQKVIEIHFTATGLPYMKKEKSGELPTNVLSGFGDTSIWRQLLIDILENQYFDYPKPNTLISSLIALHPNNLNATILDFFAGSGTTGHAVLEMNKEDNGNRTFILCQMDEKTETTPNGIATEVTAERLKRIMTGEGYKGEKDFKWIKDNEPYKENLDVYDIKTVANFEQTEGKTAFDVIDEKLYGQEKFQTLKDKVEWVTNNFAITQNNLESNEDWQERQKGEN